MATGGLPKDYMKTAIESNPKMAFEAYVAVYHACFKPATAPGPYGRKSFFHRQGLKECSERLEKRNTVSIRAGAEREDPDPDDMIEYGLRLTTSARAPFDEEAAYVILDKVVRDSRIPGEKRAIAANIACASLKGKLRNDDIEARANAFALAELSCYFGLFGWSTLHLVQLLERRGTDSFQYSPSATPNLWKAYEMFREETGIQKLNVATCVRCGHKRKGEKLSRCAGLCGEDKKPTYCGRECQKADWKRHRKWCKIEKVESDGEWTTDSEREDWEYNEDDLDKLDVFK